MKWRNNIIINGNGRNEKQRNNENGVMAINVAIGAQWPIICNENNENIS